MPRRWPLLYLAAAAVFASLIRFTISHGFRPDSWRCNRTFTCGGLTGNLNFPFWPDSPTNSHVDPYCDVPGFGLIGCSGPGSYPLIYLGGYYFRVLQVNQSIGSMTVVHKDLWDSTPANCQWNFSSEWKLDDHNLLRYSETNLNLNLSYNCPYNAAFNSPWKNVLACGGREAWWFKNSDVAQPHGCEGSFNFTVNTNAYEALQNGSVGLWGAVRIGFDLEFDFDSVFCFTCKSFPEKCERDSDSVGAPKCKLRGSQKWKRKLAIGLGCGLGGIAILGIICYCFLHHKKTSHRISTQLSRRTWSGHSMATNNNENGECFPGVHQFTYSELVQATDNFNPARALGDGGFGTVYYGKLQDERAVAVKRLYENNYRRVERFMNEVEILARLRHKNLVVLYGCTSRHSRELLLVYEYIPNGTVADHLHGERAEPGALPWPIRLKIAIETASALVYLHASGIIHRDVKTNNILLDNNFIVKVADFGLSRLFPTHVTHVSTVPQGTPGYVDPEYHQCYQLTEKSDVYSFGVVLVELISSMPAVDVNRQRHEINLATMAINKIQNRALHELVDPSVEFESDYRVRKMIAAVAEVAFQCLQHDRDMRPSMVYVLQVLRGIESEQYNEGNVEEMDVLVDEVVLLKSGPLPLSPDSMCSGRASGLISTTEARACDARDSSHVEEDASEYPSQ